MIDHMPSYTTDTLKAVFEDKNIGTYLFLGLGESDQAIAIGKGDRENIVNLLASLMFNDRTLMDIFTSSLRIAKAEQIRDN